MGDTLSVSIDASKDVVQPTLEEEAAKYDNLNTSSDEGLDRPEWLPEKFKSVEDMAKAYGELEKKLGTRKPVEPVVEEEEGEADNKADPPADTVEEQAREITEKAGLDFDDLSRTYWEQGSLDDKAYEKLDKAGIPKAVVDQFIAGQEALIEATRLSVFATVGGEEAYNSMTEWAADSFSKEEISSYNKAVNGNDITSAKMAVAGLKARYEASVGFEPSREVRGATAKTGATTYRSIAELEQDMGNPKYKSDPAFRKDVERKLARSDIF